MLGTQPVCRPRRTLPLTRSPAPPADAVRIRPARTDDEKELRRFLAGLSARTRELRFFAGTSGPSAGLLRTLLVVDGRRDALLAVAGERVVGHAMSFRRDAAVVEIAVVVADEWQGRGYGSRLVRRLLRRAVAGGARTVGMDVLGGNRKALDMIRRAWPDATARVSQGTVEVSATVWPPGA